MAARGSSSSSSSCSSSNSSSSVRRAAASSGSAVHAFIACNEYRQETVILERSARACGFSFRALGVGGPWHGVGTKLVSYDRALKELVGAEIHPSEPVLLLDAWDTVLLGHAEEFREKLGELGALGQGGLVIGAADRINAPDYQLAPRMERHFPDISTPWRYPNSGCLAGTASAMRDFLHCLVHSAEAGGFSEDHDDQRRLQEFILAVPDYPFQLDETCSLFQCMGEPECGWDFELAPPVTLSGEAAPLPRIRNWTTDERPIVAHGCGGHGRWFLADIYRELRLLERLGIGPGQLAGIAYAGLVPPGEMVTWEHWVNQPPWDYPFQVFNAMRAMELAKECGVH